MEYGNMIRLSEEQCNRIDKIENNALAIRAARHLKKRFPAIIEEDKTFVPRLQNALDYAATLPLRERNPKLDFLLIETFYPSFYLKPEVEKWLRTPNGYSAEQRLEDLKNIIINREKRGF